MRRVLTAVGALVMALAIASTSATPVAASPRPAAPCPARTNCWWSEVNFTGSTTSWTWVTDPGCNSAPGQERSYAFYGGQEGYFYENNNCTGRSKIATYNSESADIGFIAHSFKSACVSCKAGRVSRLTAH